MIKDTHNHPIHVEAYNEDWPRMFIEEKKRILPFIEKFADSIEHVGSTSIPNLGAKPIIDMMIGAKSLKDVEACIDPLIKAGYEYREKTVVPIPGRKFFKRYMDINTGYHMHVVVTGCEFWNEHILFRDYLRAHPDDVQEYWQLKQELAHEFKYDRKSYLDGKALVIQKILQKAMNQKI